MLETKIKDILTARRCRGTIRASITKLEAWIKRWEAKLELSASDHASIRCHINTLKAYDAEFKSYHYAMVDLVLEEGLPDDQANSDDCNDRVSEFSDRLQGHKTATETVSLKRSTVDPSRHLSKQLCYIEAELRLHDETINSMAPGPSFDTCLLRQLQKQVINQEGGLTGVTCDILTLEDEEDIMK